MKLVNSGVVSIKVQDILWIMQTNLISIAENWIKKEKRRYTVVFSILPFGNLVKKFGSNFNQDFSCLNQT